ncbi:hypothetical protein [Commensalibacter papalotli (ex Servin-Garciduenas et al. 2014)]|uniref:Uncharacterized protein n=1 Tax=Commensalibacter papalotli (ex Servin-Garciduenas et al. 2014) TaxID=1208583 RepID=W7DNF1_9PROT|nr:hypothetical protein [Commensalibacter papalotli (ex Servin-Garciduenas et al. 2014)]EUK18812.1 hypothetical protein COMX_03650 [Commensalibacter papalotli (ex Servin-Garciduenas et al. 2014)]
MNNSKKFIGSKGEILYGYQIVDRLNSGCPSLPMNINGNTELNFANVGDISYICSITGQSKITIKPGKKGQLQRMTLLIVNNANNSVVTFSENVITGKDNLYIQSTIGSFSVVEFIYDGYLKIFGRSLING